MYTFDEVPVQSFRQIYTYAQNSIVKIWIDSTYLNELHLTAALYFV